MTLHYQLFDWLSVIAFLYRSACGSNLLKKNRNFYMLYIFSSELHFEANYFYSLILLFSRKLLILFIQNYIIFFFSCSIVHKWIQEVQFIWSSLSIHVVNPVDLYTCIIHVNTVNDACKTSLKTPLSTKFQFQCSTNFVELMAMGFSVAKPMY